MEEEPRRRFFIFSSAHRAPAAGAANPAPFSFILFYLFNFFFFYI